MDRKKFLQAIKDTVLVADDTARVFLFGSRARNDAAASADWDILILVNKSKVTIQDEQRIRHLLYPLQLESGTAISTFVYTEAEWEEKMSVSSLFQQVAKEGMLL